MEGCAGEDAHRFWVLVRKEREEGCDRAEPSGEKDEKGQFFLGIDRNLVERREKFPVSALGARGIGVEEMATFEGVGQHSEGSLPGTVKKIKGTLDVLPMLKMEEGVGQRFRVSTLEDVLRGQNKLLHLEQIFGHVRVKFNGSMNRLDGTHFRRREASFRSHVRGKFLRHNPGLK